MENPQTNDSEDSSSSGNEVSPYFQRPQSAIPVAKGKGRPEEVDEIQPTQPRDPSKKKCFTCANEKRSCSGTYPFTEKCKYCKSKRRKCYPEEEGKRRRQRAEERCYHCRRQRRNCDGTYPFTQACSQCQKLHKRCSAEPPGKGLPEDQKCQRCAQKHLICFGEPPFKDKCARCREWRLKCYTQNTEVAKPISEPTQACSSYHASRRICTAEVPGKGLPKDEKCRRCANDQSKCIGEPPFKNRCRRCKHWRLKCFAQAKPVPFKKCLACGFRRRCDGKRPCTQCIIRNHACNYKEGDVKWTYQSDPGKWKEPKYPTCSECVQWNQYHLGKTLPCDGKSPCNCCLEGLSAKNQNKSSNCSYHYENGVSKYIKLHGEWAQTLRERARLRRHRARNKRRERLRQELEARAPQNDTTAEDENLLDEDFLPNNTGDKEDSQIDKGSDSSQEESSSISNPGNSSDLEGDDSDAARESDKEHPVQDLDHDQDHDHNLQSRFFNHENSKPYNKPNQERATGRDPSPPNDQNEWEGFQSGVLEEDPPNESRLRDPQGDGDGIGHSPVDGRRSKKRKISQYRSKGGFQESVGRRRL